MTELVKTIAKLEPQKWSGAPISMPGIYAGIPMDAYHSAKLCIEPSISSSGLRKIYNPCPWVKASPAHYWCSSYYNPNAIEADENSGMIVGRAAHHKLFGQAHFEREFIVKPATINGETCNRVTRQGKLWHLRQEELGLTVISKTEYDAINGIANQLMNDSLIKQGLLNGWIECSWVWKHPSGLWLKMRPDASPNASLDFVDLKLTRSIMWPDIQRSIRDYGYFMQAGMAAMGVKAITGQPLNSFTLVFAENIPPYCIEIVTLKENEIKRGVDACEIAIAKFRKCWDAKRWPGPRGDREDAQWIELSDADQKRMDEAMEMDRKMYEQK